MKHGGCRSNDAHTALQHAAGHVGNYGVPWRLDQARLATASAGVRVGRGQWAAARRPDRTCLGSTRRRCARCSTDLPWLGHRVTTLRQQIKKAKKKSPLPTPAAGSTAAGGLEDSAFAGSAGAPLGATVPALAESTPALPAHLLPSKHAKARRAASSLSKIESAQATERLRSGDMRSVRSTGGHRAADGVDVEVYVSLGRPLPSSTPCGHPRTLR